MTDPDRDTVGRVTIVGLGPGGPQYVTQQTLDAISNHPHRFVRTMRHPSASISTISPALFILLRFSFPEIEIAFFHQPLDQLIEQLFE